MFKLPFELMLGLRYTRAKRRSGFISFISMSSMIGIALGVTALITVLSIMNGFQQELRDRILGMTAHMTLNEGNERLRDWKSLEAQVMGHPEVTGMAPNITAQAMLSGLGQVKGSIVRGVLPEKEPEVSKIAYQMKSGQLSDLKEKQYKIILGAELASSLNARVGDKITVIAPQGTVSPLGLMPRIKRFTVSGIFQVGMHEYDSSMAFIHLADAQKLFKFKEDEVSGLQLQIRDLFDVHQVTASFYGEFNRPIYVSDWTQQHANFFRAIEMEKKMMFIVLALIIMVAAFNIVSTMVMVVTDKQADIAVLRTIGASPASIQMIFMIQGLVIGLFGALLGIAGGVLLALNIDVIVPFIENLLGFKFFPGDVYYISEVPSLLIWSDVYAVSGLAFVLTLLATLYPARKASKVQPAEALRYE
jgi:lipoprotein-releasing system permease protein